MGGWLGGLKCQSPSALLGLVPMPSMQAGFQPFARKDTLPAFPNQPLQTCLWLVQLLYTGGSLVHTGAPQSLLFQSEAVLLDV